MFSIGSFINYAVCEDYRAAVGIDLVHDEVDANAIGDDLTRRATVPIHGARSIRPGTLRAVLRGARLTVDELKGLR